MAEEATKANLATTEADLKAAIELAKLRLKVRLVGCLIADLVAVVLLLCAVGLLFVP
jgi:hypothetical protein